MIGRREARAHSDLGLSIDRSRGENYKNHSDPACCSVTDLLCDAGHPSSIKTPGVGPPHPMNTQEEAGSSVRPESVLRLRRGHMPVTSEGTNSQHELYPDTCALQAEPPPCPAQENTPEESDEVEEAAAEDEGFMGMTPLLQAHHAMERVEEFVCKVWEGRWRVIPHDVLPDWLKDNDYLLHGHRPPMPSFRACFRSIFRIHTETGNIWTHLLGCVFFLCLGIFYMFRPNMAFIAPVQEKVVFGLFFLGAILCLSFSWLFHTVYCHSEGVSRVFSKLDYSGIALLIMGSFVPWLYYSFYCNPQPCFIYLIIICVLGIAAIIVSQWDLFATPQYRGVRAGVFVGLGLSGIIPTLHFVISEGFLKAATMGQIGWLLLMASLYITGAALYAARIPERFFPGKCDIWFHSHQLFHIFVVAGAFVHFHGVSNLQEFRFTVGGGCAAQEVL
ncbi:adiponectin receptor protein 2 isoform X2 [Dendropsophus ebraccatus]|uniref:adiponectin receptor protein 2 isoform X2 n=1 Tax=Dendropsophus ebraccatus TaxID=150705 RepID=UPI0038320717